MEERTYRLVQITSNTSEYKDAQVDTIEFPQLVDYLRHDEYGLFVIDLESRRWYRADDFFHQVDIHIFNGQIDPSKSAMGNPL